MKSAKLKESTLNQLIKQTSLSEKATLIAKAILVDGYPLKPTAKAFGVTFQRVHAIKERVLQVLNHDPVLDFEVRLLSLVEESKISETLKKEIIKALKGIGLFGRKKPEGKASGEATENQNKS